MARKRGRLDFKNKTIRHTQGQGTTRFADADQTRS